MRARTLRTLSAAGGGALAGALLTFGVLALLGRSSPREQPAPTDEPVPVGTPLRGSRTPSPEATPELSPAPTGETGRVTAERLQASFVLPEGYRVASALNEFERSLPGPPRFTVTRAGRDQEQEYVSLVAQLQSGTVATEAPEFFPGKTITLSKADALSDADRALAKSAEPVSVEHGLSGTRFRRVEGLFLYDVTYLGDTEKKYVTIAMSYAAEDPAFDEGAYGVVLRSLRALSRNRGEPTP